LTAPRAISRAPIKFFCPICFPPFLYQETRKNHGVVACEGSMFKSKFANALTTMMIGSLGHASSENKLSIGYGAEAGHMDSLIEKMCARYVHDSLVITRNVESQSVLGKLGISPNWAPIPRGPLSRIPMPMAAKAAAGRGLGRKDSGADALSDSSVRVAGEGFSRKIPFARVTTGAYKQSQYRTVYFHESGAEVDRKFKHYIDGFVSSTRAFQQKHKVFYGAGRHRAARRRGLPAPSPNRFPVLPIFYVR